SASAALLFATKETAFITLGTMLIACFSVWVWRQSIRRLPLAQLVFSGGVAVLFHPQISTLTDITTIIGISVLVYCGLWLISKFVEITWVRLIVAAHAVLAASALCYRENLMEGGSWLYDNFLGAGKIQEPFVFYAIVFIGVVTLAAWFIFLADLWRSNEAGFDEPIDITWHNFRDGVGKRADLILIMSTVATIFILVSVVFFTSFFTYAEGVKKAFEAYTIWTKTGSKDHTQNGIFAYLKWGMKVESPILILSALGALIALLKARHRFAMFTAFWAFGLFAAYSIIPYKTPWLALSFLLPMCIIAGYGIGELLTSKNLVVKISAAVLAVSGTALLAYQTYDLNFVRYDDEEMAYVYAHTKRGFLDLLREIDHYADKSGMGKDAVIEIVSPDYWPMTWYVSEYNQANFHGQLVNVATPSEMIIAKKDDQDNAMIQKYSTNYKYVGVYPLRPGVNLVLLVRRDLADNDAQEMYKVLTYKPIPGYTN
ncbi:MAG: hypothetical protein ABJB40_03495, partial [Acidobacteriota bacterium]